MSRASEQKIEKILQEELGDVSLYQEPNSLIHVDSIYIAHVPAWSKCYRNDVQNILKDFINHKNYYRCISRIMDFFEENQKDNS